MTDTAFNYDAAAAVLILIQEGCITEGKDGETYVTMYDGSAGILTGDALEWIEALKRSGYVARHLMS